MPTFPKPRAPKLLKSDRKVAREAIDRAESRKVKARSGGQCEITWLCACGDHLYRCHRKAVHVHHRLSGVGVRGRGDSALADNKLHVCLQCHEDIHAHRIVHQRAAGASGPCACR